MIIRSIVGLAAAATLAGCAHRPAAGSDSNRCAAAAHDAYRIGEGADESPRRDPILAAMTQACGRDGWSDAAIACLARTTTIKDDACAAQFTADQHAAIERAFEAGKDAGAPTSDPPAVADDPACTAAANGAAEAIARDAKVAPDRRETVMAGVRAAILEPCRAGVLSAELLECLAENEEHFGICGIAGGQDWDAVKASLEAHGFGAAKP